MGIKTPLDTMSIALQNGRKSNQKNSSKQTANTTPPLVKPPQSQWQQRIQDFKEQMKMPPVGTENMQSAPPKKTESVRNAPPKGIASMQNASPYNTESQQTLYSEEILTKEPGKEWEGFNSQIKAWQNCRGYSEFKTIHGKKLKKNLRILKDLLKAEWLREIKKDLILREL